MLIRQTRLQFIEALTKDRMKDFRCKVTQGEQYEIAFGNTRVWQDQFLGVDYVIPVHEQVEIYYPRTIFPDYLLSKRLFHCSQFAEQGQGFEIGLQLGDCVHEIRLIRKTKRRRAIKTRTGDHFSET